jgi:hypothetical protein
VKAVVIDEFELCIEADSKEAEKSYFRLLDEGKLFKKVCQPLIHRL